MEGLQGPTAMLSMQSKINANTKAIAAGGGGGGAITVKGGDSTFTDITTLDFTSLNTAVSEDPSGTATIGISEPKQGFSPINIAACQGMEGFEATGNTILYLTIAEETMEIDRCTVWGVDSAAGDGQVEVKFYRYGTGWGSAGSVPFIGATSAATLGNGPNDITLTTVGGENAAVTAGETIIVGIRHLAGTFYAVSDTGLSNKNYGVTVADAEMTMPFPATTPLTTSEEWIETETRPAMTLWKS